MGYLIVFSGWRNWRGAAALNQSPVVCPFRHFPISNAGHQPLPALIMWADDLRLPPRDSKAPAPRAVPHHRDPGRGCTTFSTFSLDAVLLYERGEIGAAAAYCSRRWRFAID